MKHHVTIIGDLHDDTIAVKRLIEVMDTPR
jgi:hypothetical protein